MTSNNSKIIFPAEWAPQSGVMLTWPHEGTDWVYMMNEVENCFAEIAGTIAEVEKVLIVCRDKSRVAAKLNFTNAKNIFFAELPSNDTWARDHGAITVYIDNKPVLYDFTFNGWGMKFAADKDNQLNRLLLKGNFFRKEIDLLNQQHLVLEGGSLESDGQGTLLTTRQCLLSFNRNDFLTEKELEGQLKELFGFERVLWLSSGYLTGDDTDSHVDTLARFCSPEMIAYVKCDDPEDEHYEALAKMESELRRFKTLGGNPYDLVPLPMADPVYDEEGQRLPATYANFLIINKLVLLPMYQSGKDQIAYEQLAKTFPDREIRGINCLPLIQQHGSLHCVTMQFPEGVI